MRTNFIEAVMGGVVLLVASFFLFIVYTSSSQDVPSGVVVKAGFDRIDGIIVGSDVRLNGVKIGSVKAVTIDPKLYHVVVTMVLRQDLKIPTDSSAEIISSGLLGDKYIALVPGGEETYLEDGASLSYTQPSIPLESLIARFLFSSNSGDEDKKKGQQEPKGA
jgi:phospholipid/cholesterol/gamma-HCH transport system substrate-binding protein